MNTGGNDDILVGQALQDLNRTVAKGADLEIADYDCFVLVGAHHSAAHMVAMFPFDVSAGFRARAVQEICQKSRLFDFAQKIRAVSAVRILLVTKGSVPGGGGILR